MEYLALYRKYRPKELDEVVGQSEIKKILASSVKNETITHAYLFSGPRGTGKTTMAKILAKMVNCANPIEGNACNKCESCLNILNSNDVIEIDAASNNGVDEIRDLREKANLVPSNAKYKVYIIDEVHMLTTQAFNALLKTLEEPPKHVIFILATTEYYKIPLTITSRCQKFQFSKISNEEIVDRLKAIAKLEKIKITDDALFEIAKISDGGMRDSINFLDQLRSFNSDEITINDVYEVCGNISSFEMLNLLDSISKNNAEQVTEFFENMDVNGKNYGKFLENMVAFLKDIILYTQNVSSKYIKSDDEILKKVNNLFSNDQIYYIVEQLNTLIDKLKNVSRQSVMVITNFLLIMYKLNRKDAIAIEKKYKTESLDTGNENYDMAFQFTSNETKSNENDVDNCIKEDMSTDNIESEIAANNINKDKEIIINNAFAVASKEIKNNLQELMSKFSDYLTDKKFKVAAGTLIDTKIEVAGHGYIIMSATNEAVVQKIYDNYKLCQELINTIFSNDYNFVVLSYDEWDNYKNEYVKNFRNGKKYTLKEFERTLIPKTTESKQPTIVDKLFEIVGEDNVEFK